MKTNSDPDKNAPLLDAMLQDEQWHAANAALKAEALKTFHTTQRIRRVTRWAGGVFATALLLAGMTVWVARPGPQPHQMVAAVAALPSRGSEPVKHLTDAELVAAFPKGTCFIAEVDGKKQLIFANPELRRAYVVRPPAQGN
jgi:hypothetical protein